MSIMDKGVMWDLLPEEFPYEDKGCEMASSCLRCPFPECLEDEPRGKSRLRMRRQAERMAELRREGKGIKEIGVMFAVSERTVRRRLERVEVGVPGGSQ